MIKPLYKPAGMIANVLGGLLAGRHRSRGPRPAERDACHGRRHAVPQGRADARLAVPALVAAELPRLRRANPGTG
jgi:hypothetical protein